LGGVVTGGPLSQAHPCPCLKGVEATQPDANIEHLNCDLRIVNKMLACLPGSEYGLDGFKEKLLLKNM
jgi:hypothetical protein